MSTLRQTLQVAFTYIGTVVGAGFATGQEILQFFTKYGWLAVFTIAMATFLFIWLGTKLLLKAHEIKATSYEDFNKYLFGKTIGTWISNISLILLFGVATVMLAGAGSVFVEHLHLGYQIGLLLTLGFAYLVLSRGIHGIMAINSIVVPIMLVFTVIVVVYSYSLPTQDGWLRITNDHTALQLWTSPLLYAAFNLSMAQAVLVPLGAAVHNRRPLYYGGILGGIGIGLMLLAGHYALSAQMPGITQFDIPMGHLIINLSYAVQLIYIVIIYAEIFTTFIADVYGIVLQLHRKTSISEQKLLITILILCYLIGQIGFTTLLSILYPLFGVISLAWLIMMIRPKKTT